MSDRIEWNIEECKQVAIGLNQQGTLIKNALAGVYNTFRSKISGVWSGKNYNKVVEYVNGFAPDFKSMTEYLGVTIPETIKEIVNAQAANGGISESFSLASDGSNPDIWTVELSNVSSDGAIKINIDAVNQYITGSQYPSIRAALDLALQYFNNYVNILEQNMGYFNDNKAVMDAYNTIQDYKSKFENDTRNMIDTIVDAANQEISGIEDVDLKTQQDAQKINNAGGSASPNASGGILASGSSSSPNAAGGSSVSGSSSSPNAARGSSVSGRSSSPNAASGSSGSGYRDSNSSSSPNAPGASSGVAYKDSNSPTEGSTDMGANHKGFVNYYESNDYWKNIGKEYSDNWDYSDANNVGDYVVDTAEGVIKTAWDGVGTVGNGTFDTANNILEGAEWLLFGGGEGQSQPVSSSGFTNPYNPEYYTGLGKEFSDNWDYSNANDVGDYVVDTAEGVVKTVWDGAGVAVHGVVDTAQGAVECLQGAWNWLF